MELAYLYIEEHRNLKKIELNFSRELQLEYKEDGRKLEVKRRTNALPIGFWGENINNLTMIVGNNAAGKTSIMQYLISVFQSLERQEKTVSEGILVIQNGKRLYYHELGYRIGIADVENVNLEEDLKRNEYQVEKIGFSTLREMLRATKLIYLTNTISFADYQRGRETGGNRFSPLYDCSIGGLMYYDSVGDVNRKLRKKQGNISEFETYYTYEKYKQVKFVFDKRQHKILEELKRMEYSVPVPEKLYIKFYLSNQLELVLKNEEVKECDEFDWDEKLFPKETEKLEIEIKKYRNTSREYETILLRYQFCRCCIWGLIRSISRMFELRGEFFKELAKIETNNVEVQNEFKYVIEQIFAFSKRFAGENEKYLVERIKNLEEKGKSHYFAFIEYIEEQSKNQNIATHLQVDRIERQEIQLSLSTMYGEWFMRFLKMYRYTAEPDYYLDFDWGLSSGETNLLSTFALLYCIFPMDYTNEKNGTYKIKNQWGWDLYEECNSVVLMIDEADLTLHPEWQREYIASLLAFLVRVYPKECCKNIQLIISTHSPILLSDVPQQNIIYLKTDENHKVKIYQAEEQLTFSQNIHNLYKDGFFLEKGTMGRFAYEKIKSNFKEIQDLSKKIEDLQNGVENDNAQENYKKLLREIERKKAFASLIAEPIIRRKLLMEITEVERKLTVKEEWSDRYQSFNIDIEYMKTLSNEKLQELTKRLTEEIERRGQSDQ